jgi:hemerythrin-like domain-containing protein
VSEEIKELLFLLHNDRLTEAGKRKLEQEIERLNTDKEQLTSLVNSCQKEIKKLRNQLQQKDNIIKEAREYIEKLFYFSDEDDISRKISKDIKQILDKENKE